MLACNPLLLSFKVVSLDLTIAMISARKRRPHHTQFMSYHEKEVPTEPNLSAVQILQNKRVSPATIHQIKAVWNFYYLAVRLCWCL